MRSGKQYGGSRRAFLAGAAGTGVLALSGCIRSRADAEDGGPTGDDDGPLSGSIAIAGSSTVFPLTDAVRTEFLETHPNVSISLQSTGTGGGFGNFFCTGDRVINNASRPITGSEREQCAENGVDPLELRVATDAMTVIVNNEADWVDCLTVEELTTIWGPGGAARWSDVREEWPDETFDLFGPASTSGTFDYFTETVIGEEDAHREDYQPTEDDNTILTGVRGSEYAMGYLGFAHYSDNTDSVKALAVEDPDTDAGCVPPRLETAAGGEYTPLSRPLFIYVDRNALADEHVAEFCRFYVKQAANRELVAGAVGYVPLTRDQQATQLGTLELAIDEVQ
jgi:phosphate transport system substrate-binding protein